MRPLRAALIAGFVFVATPSSAQVVDLSTISCKAFLDSSKDTIGSILMWLDAYFRDEDATPVIDFDKLKQKAEKLAAFCATNPTIGLLTAAEPIMEPN